MADRTQLRVADNNDIAEDDPFAELTRIMGFDPRQPVKPQAPAVETAADEGDFDIDLEKELMGEFGDEVGSMEASQPAPEVHQPAAEPYEPAAEIREPAFETTDAAMDDALAASLEYDFVFDDAADLDFGAAPQAAAAPVEPSFAEPSFAEPAFDEAAFDDDFDNAVASSLENVSPLEDDLPMDDDLAASLEQGLLLDDGATVAHAADVAQVAAAPADDLAFDDDFDNAVSMSLEDELTLDGPAPAQDQYAAPVAEAPIHTFDAAGAADHAVADEDFAVHFDDAMADVDMDFAAQDFAAQDFAAEHFEPQAFEAQPVEAEDPEERDLDVSDLQVSAPVEMDAPEVDETPAWTVEASPSHETAHEAFDDFDLSIDDAVADHELAAEIAPTPVQPTPVAPAYVAPTNMATPAAPVADERTLEDELNALLGAMTTPRPAPVAPIPVVTEPTRAAAIEPTRTYEPVAPVQRSVATPVAPVDNLDWDLDEHAPAPQEAQADDADFDDLLAGELEGHVPEIEFDDHAFDAALAKGIDLGHDDTAAPVAGDWRSTPPEPARSWSRVTPTPAQPSFAAQPQPSFAAQPQASFAEKPSMPPAAAPSYRDQPVAAAAYVAPTPSRQAPPQAYVEMPDVETVDVPERVVAIADDLDIPELSFEQDEPAAYDDIDAEFAGMLNEMNAVEVAPPTAARSAGYDDDSYSSGFGSGHELDQRAYAARPAEVLAATQAHHADAAGGFDMDDLPGSQPVSQADDFAVDELDYDPDLDEAMAVPGLAEQEAARPRRSGLLVAGVVAAVAIAGGLGAFALSFGGKGGSDAPVIVKADNRPIKVKPENPGGAVVPNQDNKVYDAVAKGTKPAEPVQEKLVTNTEEPVDVKAQEPESRVVDLSPDDTAPGPDAAGNPEAAVNPDAAGNPDAAVAPAPKSEDRIAQVLQEAEKNPDTVAVAPRKVRTMVVKPDGSLVAREDSTPAAPQVAATEPLDPAPQHVAPSADAEQTGTVAPADQANSDQASAETAKPVKPVKPAATPKAETQSANTPQTVAVAPQRPSDQPVDVVGEVKPDQVASIPATASTSGGSWSMQIASQPTVESAQANYADLQRRYGNVLAGRTANIVKAEIAGKGTFYRVRVPAQSRNDAINLCTSYKAAGGNCFVSR
ncbi:SPOR domain-containing protein [Mesorhizobium sp. M0478]|uniref:SPOR domain-containing protein n=1 Tax=Mesorhizobium sp. M0478 TaxID=2956947 RepID=UPI00333C5704